MVKEVPHFLGESNPEPKVCARPRAGGAGRVVENLEDQKAPKIFLGGVAVRRSATIIGRAEATNGRKKSILHNTKTVINFEKSASAPAPGRACQRPTGGEVAAVLTGGPACYGSSTYKEYTKGTKAPPYWIDDGEFDFFWWGHPAWKSIIKLDHRGDRHHRGGG